MYVFIYMYIFIVYTLYQRKKKIIFNNKFFIQHCHQIISPFMFITYTNIVCVLLKNDKIKEKRLYDKTQKHSFHTKITKRFNQKCLSTKNSTQDFIKNTPFSTSMSLLYLSSLSSFVFLRYTHRNDEKLSNVAIEYFPS